MGDSADEENAPNQPVAPGQQPLNVVNNSYSAPRLHPPDKFDFNDPGQWTRWRARWMRYREASRLNTQSDREQVNTLVYTLGEQAEDVILARAIPEDNHDNLITAFDRYFGVRTNTIVERAKFNKLVQGTDGMDTFIHKLYRQAEYCGYGTLREELIRDRLVVGVADDRLSDKLQSEAELALEDAVIICRRYEANQMAQTLVRPTGTVGNSVEMVRSNKPNNSSNKGKGQAKQKARSESKPHQQSSNSNSNYNSCTRCGKSPNHAKQLCPALKSKCSACHKIGHWKIVCRSLSKVTEVNAHDGNMFLGEIRQPKHGKPWTANIHACFDNDNIEQCIVFKLDTGADVSICNMQSYKGAISQLTSTDKHLVGAGNFTLPVRGKTVARLRVDNRIISETLYVVENQSCNLLSKQACVALGLISCNSEHVDSVSNSNVCDFINEYPEIFTGLGKLSEPYTIQVRDDVRPVALHVPYDVSQPRLKLVKSQLDDMEAKGVISKVTVPTEWCSGMVQVPKDDPSQIRICADLTNLNRAVMRDTHPSASVDATLAKISGAKIMTKLDANSGYYQIPLADESKLLTTFITPFGRYCYNRVPFGLVSAGDIFQRCMRDILEGIDGVVCHMDDLLIYSTTSKLEHDERVRKVLDRLKLAGMTLNQKKCKFSQTSLTFLGHLVSVDGIRADPDRVKDLQDLPDPTNKTQLQSLLGSVNQLGKFSPNITNLTTPLRALLKKNTPWYWDVAQKQAVVNIKRELCNTPCLAWYSIEKPIVIMCDASNSGLGATLFQVQSDGTRRLVAAKSRSLTETEQRWSPIEKEALGIAWSCSKFEMYILGHSNVTIETDHKPLVPIFNSKAVNDLTLRIQRQRLRTMKFSFVTKHISGKDNHIADLLSRQPIGKPTQEDVKLSNEIEVCAVRDNSTLPVSEQRLCELKTKQSEDATCRQVKHYIRHGWPSYLSDLETNLKPYLNAQADLTLIDELLVYRNTRIVIPISERIDILKRIHTGHLGIQKCRERVRQSVWWPGVSQEIADMVKSCNICRIHQPTQHEPLLPSICPDRPWQRVATDLFYWKNSNYLLMVDYYSRYIEIIKLDDTTSMGIINALKSIFARHGIPETVVSDNGPQYASQQFKNFASEYNFVSVTSSPRYAQGNGEAERAVRTVKNILTKSPDPYLGLLSYRNTPIQNGYSPTEFL